MAQFIMCVWLRLSASSLERKKPHNNKPNDHNIIKQRLRCSRIFGGNTTRLFPTLLRPAPTSRCQSCVFSNDVKQSYDTPLLYPAAYAADAGWKDCPSRRRCLESSHILTPSSRCQLRRCGEVRSKGTIHIIILHGHRQIVFNFCSKLAPEARARPAEK